MQSRQHRVCRIVRTNDNGFQGGQGHSHPNSFHNNRLNELLIYLRIVAKVADNPATFFVNDIGHRSTERLHRSETPTYNEAMVEVKIEDDKAVFEVLGSHSIWAFKSRLEIPLLHIASAEVKTDPPMGWFDSIKLIGTDVPHFFRAGTFLVHGKTVFFDVRNPQKTVSVQLRDDAYSELLIEVEDPEGVVALLDGAVRDLGGQTVPAAQI
jgi:hypothetical protein